MKTMLRPCAAFAAAASLALPLSAVAQQATPPAAPAPAAPTSNAMSMPAMAGPLAANPNPYSVDLGPLGKTYITGAVTGMGFGQTDPTTGGIPANRNWYADLTNGLVNIQKTDGMFQYFIEAGAYSFPTIGVPYADASHTNSNTFGPLPLAYAKLAPNDSLSIEAGKLPTLIGEELPYTFENLNIERGLLWNQENLINRGVQVNYTTGPLAFAVSWNDGFYSNDYTYLTGAATWTVDSANTLILAGGGNTATTTTLNSATPQPFANQQMYDLSWTYANGPWMINPYIQYTHVPAITELGTSSGSTYGAALLASYGFDSAGPLAGFSLPARVEYIDTSGSQNLLYGAKSSAWSLTVTPTYQYKIFFARVEASYVGVSKSAVGAAFGSMGNDKSQFRGLLEAGFVF